MYNSSSSLLALAIAAIHWVHPSNSSSSKPRRILRPKDNVGEMLKRNHDPRAGRGRDVVIRERYTIHTEIEVGSEAAGTQLAMDVVEASTPAVTLDTLITDERGEQYKIGDEILLYTLLVTDVDTADGADTFAMLAVNPETNDMHGVVEKKGKRGERVPYRIRQSRDENEGMAMAQEEMELPPPDWHCDVDEKNAGDEASAERGLKSDHPEHHHHTQVSAMKTLTKSVQGIEVNPLNKLRRLKTSYNFEVEMFIEIDNAFVSKLGGLNNAVNYVNTLVTGANVVYEKEIDTHLRVTNIKVSTHYDGVTSTAKALSIMRSTYGGDTWHSPNVDIHHALLGNIGGGIAYIGVVCHSNFAFGLTGGIKGSFESMGQPVVWDMKGFMHEIGHNFGSGHTHDTHYFDPAIDECGYSCPSSAGYGWSTIMSYCQWCPGSYGNVMYTFGADYDGSGDVNDLANWPANPNLVANYDSAHKSVDPSRQAQKMYLHILSKAPSGCVSSTIPASLVAPLPTHSPTSSVGIAFYDATLGAPKCSKVASFCDSGSLLKSRASIGGMSEPNGSNTLDECADGTSGHFHSDESVDSIRVSAIGGGNIQVGSTVEITAEIWAYSASADWVDFFYSTDATNPEWQLIKTTSPVSSGASTASAKYTLSNGGLQAVRVVIRYNGVASSCPGGSYDDVDVLVFAVDASLPVATVPSQPNPKSTPTPTDKPTPLPTEKPTRFPTHKPTPIPTDPPITLPTRTKSRKRTRKRDVL